MQWRVQRGQLLLVNQSLHSPAAGRVVLEEELEAAVRLGNFLL